MHHGMGHFNACRISIKDQAANFVFEDRDQIRKLAQILFRAMNGRGQMSFERASNL